MSIILDTVKATALSHQHGTWLILDCGHWYKWTGKNKPPTIGKELACPDDNPIEVVPYVPAEPTDPKEPR